MRDTKKQIQYKKQKTQMTTAYPYPVEIWAVLQMDFSILCPQTYHQVEAAHIVASSHWDSRPPAWILYSL